MKRTFAVAAVLVVCVSRSLLAQCSDADRSALQAFDKAWGDASTRGDRAFLEQALAPGFVAHAPAGVTDRATAITNTMTAFEAARTNPQPVTVPDRYTISCSGNTATITHRNTTPAAAGSNDGPAYSRSVHFLEKRGNRWQVVSSTGHGLQDGALLVYMEQDWSDAYKARDVAWFERNYASDATEVSFLTGKLESKSQSIASMKADKAVYESLELSDMNARVDGDMAVVTGINHVKGRAADGKPIDWRLRFTDTFVKRDGRWLVLATQGTTIP